MARNDLLFKILFALQVALIPLVIFAFHFVETAWVMGLLVGGAFVCHVWMEIFKDKFSFQHNLINSIGSIITIGLLLVFLACVEVIIVPIAVIAIIAVIFANIMKMAMLNKHMPEMIEAVDFCYTIFECILLLALAFARVSIIITNIAMFAVIITAVVTVAYKIFFAFKYTDLVSNIKKLFTRK